MVPLSHLPSSSFASFYPLSRLSDHPLCLSAHPSFCLSVPPHFPLLLPSSSPPPAQIPFASIRERAVQRGIRLARVQIRDFDHGDQAMMLPQAVRVLNLLLSASASPYTAPPAPAPAPAGGGSNSSSSGEGSQAHDNGSAAAPAGSGAVAADAAGEEAGARVYVHCTAGINRASLTALSLLTFVRVSARVKGTV